MDPKHPHERPGVMKPGVRKSGVRKPGVMEYAYSPGAPEVERGGSLEFTGMPT